MMNDELNGSVDSQQLTVGSRQSAVYPVTGEIEVNKGQNC